MELFSSSSSSSCFSSHHSHMRGFRILLTTVLTLCSTIISVSALRYTPDQVHLNLNQNPEATNPLDYSGTWENHTYMPSPANWRMPFYTLFLDRYVNGDPSNDDANGTAWEYDMLSNQLRAGGDVKGLVDGLDYLQGMGIKAIYLSGSPLINAPWSSDGFSPQDLTLLDAHFGSIQDWRDAIDEIHRRGMYVIIENTFATMGDLFGFEGYLNESTPFSFSEHNAVWKSSRRYHDFAVATDADEGTESCTPPRFWTAGGLPVGRNVTDKFHNQCRKGSEFDQYGDIAAFGNYPEWQRQLSKFAFVQDRLREWDPRVLAKIMHFSCLFVEMLDIDGFRIDKALQVTVDAQGEFSEYMRTCTKRLGKDNFYIPGEVVSGNAFSAIYMGRGKEPKMAIADDEDAILAAIKNSSSSSTDSEDLEFIRPTARAALDGVAFHYSIYRALTRFLGLDGEFAAEQDTPVNFVDAWQTILRTNDHVNAATGDPFDPRHMYGASNQDVFRWPALRNGTAKQNLAYFVITLLLPGVPMTVWGEEQMQYVFDNTADNYLFSRQPMVSAQAWQTHGCYQLGGPKYHQFPLEKGLYGCLDDGVSKDQRNPAHPARSLIKHMYQMREEYPVLNDGFSLVQLSNQTWDIFLPGSGDTRTETGMWSVLRSRHTEVQDFSGQAAAGGNQSVWLVYGNQDEDKTYKFNCSDPVHGGTALLAPFDAGTTVRNLFWPFEEYTLTNSSSKLGFEGSSEYSGCLSELRLPAWGYKALVPVDTHVLPRPTLTRIVPGHDARILSTTATANTVNIELHFSEPMSCDSIAESLVLSPPSSSTVDNSTIHCAEVGGAADSTPAMVGERPTAFLFAVTLRDVVHGIHTVSIKNATNADGSRSTGAIDKFMFRIGAENNPMVFPRSANYSSTLLHRSSGDGSSEKEEEEEEEGLYITHSAAGADKWRYSLNWKSTWSDWLPYPTDSSKSTLSPQAWSGTEKQRWEGQHVVIQYWSRTSGSGAHIQHGDLAPSSSSSPATDLPAPRRFPHLFLHGPFNAYGFDAGLPNVMRPPTTNPSSRAPNKWTINFNAEWPTYFSLNAWGINPDGQPDATYVLGDVNNDRVLDRIPPLSLLTNVINITRLGPEWPYLAWRLEVDDASMGYELVPVGSQKGQMVLFLLLALVPVLAAATAVWVYGGSFYQVKFNRRGVEDRGAFVDSLIPAALQRRLRPMFARFSPSSSTALVPAKSTALAADEGAPNRRTVLIATMEYDIADWGIKIKIGGLGVMAQLMGANLGHQDLIWVVPCVGGVDYPVDNPAPPMEVTILGNSYTVDVQYHVLRNITYVLLDAPVFRAQTKAEPYPPRMDDLHSAVYYSAWNSCIAQTIQRFNVDLYHINDYHGAVAPLHLLPQTIPCALSLHNAEFQGLWPMRNPREREEVCRVFNLDPVIMARYVQFGDVYNLLHAAVSYLRIHQNGFGAVGVSRKYGARAYARYPIFWGLKGVGSLPNPDPTDVGEYNRQFTAAESEADVEIDEAFEASRAGLKRQAQEWAGLELNPDADLLVFVGRWSMQKGVDLIADVFPAIIEGNPKVQLICIGPVIDLYGKFAALKLEKMMALYPGRVFSKPEFTALPPYIFSGAEFALIPSRDEPFGLVAVEFGRKGALGIGSRVGGLGNMPGWWFTIESTTTKHLIAQFRTAIEAALASKPRTRAIMRARSQKQRFPVAQWVEDLEILQSEAMRVHNKEKESEAAGGLGMLGSWPQKVRAYRNNSDLEQQQPVEGKTGGILSLFGRKSATPVLEEPKHEEVDGRAVATPPELPSGFVPYQTSPQSGLPAPTFALSPSADNSAPESIFTSAVASPSNSLHPTPFHSPPHSRIGSAENSRPTSSHGIETIPQSTPFSRAEQRFSNSSVLSLPEVVGDRKDFKLQKVDLNFTDSTGEYYKAFAAKLDAGLDGKTSEDHLCVEEYLIKSEKKWFGRFHDAKMGRASPAGSLFRFKRNSTPPSSIPAAETAVVSDDSSLSDGSSNGKDEFQLGDEYVPPSGAKWALALRLGDWPVYTILLAFGQIIAANSYQITLLTGEVGQTPEKLYVVASIYLVTSIVWWFVFRRFKSVYVLSIPFLFYGLAFFFIGIAPFVPTMDGRGWVQNIATAMYATASSSGSIFFALNFGDEGGAPIESWVYRACVIQGSQQAYVVGLWYWGSVLTARTVSGALDVQPITSTWKMSAITLPIAAALWLVGILLYIGLPDYYRQAPGTVPSFYMSLFRRKIIGWFFLTVLLQNYFLSAPYGRNWRYLWSSAHAEAWQIGLLCVLFFGFVWAAWLYAFSRLSSRHSWILPVFAIGLGAPRWCQMLWGVSGIGSYIPLAGSPLASALAGRSLWLWLGVLDALQGVGFGMILLQTLTRIHIAFTLIAAQVLGSAATILARATAPNRVGPGDVFPDFAFGWSDAAGRGWFWGALAFQLIICWGFFKFFRKEQLLKA